VVASSAAAVRPNGRPAQWADSPSMNDTITVEAKSTVAEARTAVSDICIAKKGSAGTNRNGKHKSCGYATWHKTTNSAVPVATAAPKMTALRMRTTMTVRAADMSGSSRWNAAH
jgi:hypothetical protein